MAHLKVENAWVEFPVSLVRKDHAKVSRTGGIIDIERSVVTALRDVSFELHEGDRLGLMGHNGAGKTTMLRLLAGAYPPTRGRVISTGRISTLFNTTPGLNVDGTGRENLVTCSLQLGMSRRQIDSKIDEIIDFAELGEYIDLPVRIYSAGMMTRLGFSIATAVEPEILLLDEGLATGDAQFAQKAQAKMNEFMARSSILVIASHSEAFLANTCTRSLLLEHGSIVAEGPTTSLLESYRAAIIESARADNADGLHRAYTMASDMARLGERPPLELEEQGLRHALTIVPDDPIMWQRYVSIIQAQGRPVAPDIEVRMMLVVLARDRSRGDFVDRIRTILAMSAAELPDDIREQAAAIIGATEMPRK